MHMGQLAKEVGVEYPDGLTEEHLDFLDLLRESGQTNMFGAGPYLTAEFGLDKREARKYLEFWMKTFGVRH